MNEIKKIHIGRQPFTISVDAHDALEAYLAAIGAAAKPDVLKEVEARMAELLMERGIKGKKVVVMEDIDYLKEQLGDPGNFKEEDEATSDQKTTVQTPRRLFRDTQNAWLAGVCAGLAAYLNIDVVIVRLVFIAVLLFGGAAIPIYIILWLVMPEAKTPSDRLQMQGKAVTVDTLKELVDRADIKGAAHRAHDTASPIIERAARIFLAIVGVGFIAVASGMFVAITAAATYLVLHHSALIADVIPFPVGNSELIFTAASAASLALGAMLILLVGIAMVRRKWGLPGWITASFFGLLVASGAIGAAAAPDTVTQVRDRYEAAQQTSLQTTPPYSKVQITSTNKNIDFVYEEASSYQVGTRYLGKGNAGQLHTKIENGMLKIDATDLTEACPTICNGQFNQVIIRAPKLDEVIDNNGTRLPGTWHDGDMSSPMHSGQHFTPDGYYY